MEWCGAGLLCRWAGGVKITAAQPDDAPGFFLRVNPALVQIPILIL